MHVFTSMGFPFQLIYYLLLSYACEIFYLTHVPSLFCNICTSNCVEYFSNGYSQIIPNNQTDLKYLIQ